MRETDIRRDAYNDCKKSQRKEMMLIIAILSGAGLIFALGMATVSSYASYGIALLFLTLIYIFIRAFRERHKKELEVIMRGILAEAEVVELREEKDPDSDRLITMAVYEFTLPGGRKHRIKESVTSTMAGVLGAIRVGTKATVFVDPNNPDIFYLVKPKVTEQTFQDMGSPAVQDMDSVLRSQYLQKQRKGSGRQGSKELFHAYKKSQRAWKAIAATFLIGVFGGLLFMVYNNWRNLRHDDIDLPSGTYISLIGPTEVYQYFPETNEWSYRDENFGAKRTKKWRYDSKCRKPLEIGYTSTSLENFSATGDRPVLLIPESYRDRLDEFIKDAKDTGTALP